MIELKAVKSVSRMEKKWKFSLSRIRMQPFELFYFFVSLEAPSTLSDDRFVDESSYIPVKEI